MEDNTPIPTRICRITPSFSTDQSTPSLKRPRGLFFCQFLLLEFKLQLVLGLR
jgi:hypothetical protein